MSSPNEIFLDYISSMIGVSFGESLIFWFLGFTLAAIIFFALSTITDFTKSVITVIALLPMIIIDGILSFGEYTFSLPFFGDKTITHFVMTSSFIDWVFGFQAFNSAQTTIMSYAATTESNHIIIQIITFLFSAGDSLIQIVIFSLATYYLISLYEYYRNQDFSWQLPISIIVGSIPVILYAVFFSNPIEEFHKSNLLISTVANFMDNSTSTEVIFVALSAFAAFLFVLIIISIITRFMLSTAITFIPSMQETQWRTSYVAVAFLLTILYSFLYIMHPDYKWYIIILVILVWKLFKHLMTDIAKEAKQKTRLRQRRKEEVSEIISEFQKMNVSSLPTAAPGPSKKGKMFNLEVLLIISALALFFIGFLIFKGFLWT